MHLLLLPLLFLTSALTPTHKWNPPAGPVTVNVSVQGDAKLVLTDFSGKVIDPAAPADVSGEKTIDLKTLFPKIADGGTFVLYTVPKDKTIADFVDSPLVIEVRVNKELPQGSGADGIKIEPLRYAVIHTAQGDMTCMFYYDVAPNTVDSFLRLASEGYYDKLTFHRIVPDFVLQGGDPRGDGMGGPGYDLNAEFNDRPHEEGVLSMARSTDPNSAGSQFFICLNYKQTQQLDHKYTAFGKVVDGMKTAHEIEKTPIADPQNGKPTTPQVIDQIEVKPVTAAENPYAEFFHMERPIVKPDTPK